MLVADLEKFPFSVPGLLILTPGLPPVSVQNIPALLITGAKRHDHITCVPASLHWFPVRFLINLH